MPASTPASRPSSSGRSSPTPWPGGGGFDDKAPLTQQVAYKASEAVARALLELELPGSLSHATALLRSVAEQERRGGVEDDAAYEPMVDACRPSDGGPLSRRSSSERDDYTPFESDALSMPDSPRSPPFIGATAHV